MLYFVTSSVIPLLIVLILGGFALFILKNFISKMPTPKRQERVVQVEESANAERVEDSEADENVPKIELNKKEVKSQKEQSINELNEAVMASPEDAAKLLTSFIRD